MQLLNFKFKQGKATYVPTANKPTYNMCIFTHNDNSQPSSRSLFPYTIHTIIHHHIILLPFERSLSPLPQPQPPPRHRCHRCRRCCWPVGRRRHGATPSVAPASSSTSWRRAEFTCNLQFAIAIAIALHRYLLFARPGVADPSGDAPSSLATSYL